MKEVSTKKLLDTIVEGIQNRKGHHIVIVDLRRLKDAPVDYFVIAEGNSNTQSGGNSRRGGRPCAHHHPRAPVRHRWAR